MNFSCDKCQRRYSIADEKVRGKTVKVRCKNCQNVISVQGPPAEMEESTRVVSLADVNKIREQERAMAAAASAPADTGGANPWEDEPTRAAPVRAPAAPWFVMVKSKQEGPLDEAGLRGLVESGAVNGRSFFWQQGMADWKRGAEIPELAGIFEAPAPPPPAPPPALPPEPATVGMRGPGRTVTGSSVRAQPAPQAVQQPVHEDHSWDDVPTTVGQVPMPAAATRAPWDLDAPAAAPAPSQRQTGQRQQLQPQQWQQQQQQPAWDMDAAAQQEQPLWDDSAQQAQQQEQPLWDDSAQQAQQQEQPLWDDSAQQQDQPAWDEPAQQQPAAHASNGGGGKVSVGDDLFSDLDLPDRNEPMEQPEPPTTIVSDADPLEEVRLKSGKSKKVPVEDTHHFMVKSGVTRRNPAWKVALFILLPILLLGGGVFALDQLNVVPKVKVVNAQGQTEEKSLKSLIFSGEGRGELRDLLLGRNKPAPAPAPTPAPNDAKPPPGGAAQKPEGGAPGATTPAVPETGKSPEELKALYGDASKTDVGPAVRKDTEVAPADAASTGGLPPEDVLKVVEKSQGAFQGCVETELRKNPRFKGGKVVLVATVGTSGVVKGAKLDRKELDASPVGDCIKKSARRMVFPAFKMDDGSAEVDVEIPLVLTSGAM